MLRPFSLTGRHVRLEPLSTEHVPGLAAAAAEDRSSYAFTRVPDGLVEAAEYVRAALTEQAGGQVLPFAVVRSSDDVVVGSTRFLDLEVLGRPGVILPSDAVPPDGVEIGSTWYAASAQRTAVNTEVKLLLLAHAFEVWQALRVTLKTDARNRRSRAAIERLGARSEGIRRAHTTASDGTVRDSAYYSILAAEWPTVRDGLRRRLAAAGRAPGPVTVPTNRRSH
ncbi:GNAT family N-acetyltransferase [Blastococcus haudaquaticus]|uniref:Protein N-acetyltransferase, RimJ/RimL family n=1 Tax=Blastococcus haudaquaticus TaxID=1938745 RepID=A0A286GTZ6_9ACTN|nr:GNAT family protein [Blastococcus haudaquaticus]SOD99015.1 Protein N-acetyltransferase, RimJ/RimL family [Blastococcus haudaquaticus]